MVFWSLTFYTANAIFRFPIMDMVMTPVRIAILNTVFRAATITLLLPFISYIEKLVFTLIKDDPEDEDDKPNFDILEERFLRYPAIAISQSHTAVNGMAIQARKNIARAIDLLDNYTAERFQKIQEKEGLIDKYEDKLGTYLLQLTGKEMTEEQTREVTKFLHTISDFERLGDYAVNISKVANELMEKKRKFSEDAQKEMDVLEQAVMKIVDITVDSFCVDNLEDIGRVEPLRELIDILCDELKLRHVDRVRKGLCDMKQGFAFNDLLNDMERIAGHCSNVAVAMLELKNSSFDTHKYLKHARETQAEQYDTYFKEYEAIYNIDA
jgi:phosphate:Na+ symporter